MSQGLASLRGDSTALCELIAARLRARGAPHPVAGAVALAVRGADGVDRDAHARRLGLDPSVLDAIEAGQIAWSTFPPALDRAIAATETLDLLALVDLDEEWSGDDALDGEVHTTTEQAT